MFVRLAERGIRGTHARTTSGPLGSVRMVLPRDRMSTLIGSPVVDREATFDPPRAARMKLYLAAGLALATVMLIGDLACLRAAWAASNEFRGEVIPARTWQSKEVPTSPERHPIFARFRRVWDGHERLPDAFTGTWKARMTAFCELARLDTDCLPVLLSGMEDGDPEVRNLATQAAGMLGAPRSPADLSGSCRRIRRGRPASMPRSPWSWSEGRSRRNSPPGSPSSTRCAWRGPVSNWP